MTGGPSGSDGFRVSRPGEPQRAASARGTSSSALAMQKRAPEVGLMIAGSIGPSDSVARGGGFGVISCRGGSYLPPDLLANLRSCFFHAVECCRLSPEVSSTSP